MEHDTQSFKRGQRVRYTGNLAGALIGQEGTVQRYDRNGWCIVKFDRAGSAKTYDFNLTAI